MKHLMTLLLLCTSICYNAQASKKIFTRGLVYWGAFDAENKAIVGEWEYMATINKLEKETTTGISNYYLTGLDKDGKFLGMMFFGQKNDKSKFIDSNNLEYIIVDNGQAINLLCLKPLPKGRNLFMTMKFIDLK